MKKIEQFEFPFTENVSGNKPLNFAEYMREMSKERVRHEEKCEKLNNRLKDFQSSCKHDHTIFCSDPSGGNDSFYTCILCAKEYK